MASSVRDSGRKRTKGRDKGLYNLECRRSAYDRASAIFKAASKAPGTRKKPK